MSRAEKQKAGTGYYIRASKSGGFGVERITSSGSASTSAATIHLPDGRIVKSIDRDLFDRAVRAAAKK